MPIDATKGFSSECPAKDDAGRDAAPDLREALGVRLLLEPGDLALRDRTGRCPSPTPTSVGDRLRRDRDVGVAIDVRVDQFREVHPVEMVAREDQVVVGSVAGEVARRLAHGVGRALEPVRVVGRLLGGQDVDEAAREQVHPVRLRDVPVERGRVELREDEHPPQPGVQAVADGDVDQPVLAADRHRGLRAHEREREEPVPAPAPEDDGEDVLHGH